jgi:hypothetical protein
LQKEIGRLKATMKIAGLYGSLSNIAFAVIVFVAGAMVRIGREHEFRGGYFCALLCRLRGGYPNNFFFAST